MSAGGAAAGLHEGNARAVGFHTGIRQTAPRYSVRSAAPGSTLIARLAGTSAARATVTAITAPVAA
jgi:hypothetical protein